MCKYCKKLQEVSRLERAEYERSVKRWKNYCSKQESIIEDLFLLLEYKGVNFGPAYERIHKRACELLNEDTVR